jgi:hypothetical protein
VRQRFDGRLVSCGERFTLAGVDGASRSTALNSACEGIVRSLDCAKCLATLRPSTCDDWNVVSDEVVIENRRWVYKIFDNRFHPTFREPEAWLRTNDLWIASLGVETEYFLFKESETADPLGGPLGAEKDAPKTVPYPTGSVRVIKYKFVNGTHYASKVSHFQEIARCLEEMHKAGFVHGDVRGFNMLHPYQEMSAAAQAVEQRYPLLARTQHTGESRRTVDYNVATD